MPLARARPPGPPLGSSPLCRNLLQRSARHLNIPAGAPLDLYLPGTTKTHLLLRRTCSTTPPFGHSGEKAHARLSGCWLLAHRQPRLPPAQQPLPSSLSPARRLLEPARRRMIPTTAMRPAARYGWTLSRRRNTAQRHRGTEKERQAWPGPNTKRRYRSRLRRGRQALIETGD